MINIGLIGAGFIGLIHANAYTKLPDANLAVIADQDKSRAETLSSKIGCRAESDAEVIFLDPDISLVDVSLPTPLHPEFAIRALESGKHVIVEKPLALSLSEVDTILEAAKQSGKFLMVAHVLRFWPEYLAIRGVLQSKRLGKPLLATAHRLSNIPQWSTWFRDPKATGGTVLDLQIHDLDMMNWLFGRPRYVFSNGVRGETGDWDHVITQIYYEGVHASIEASFMMPKDFPFTAGMRILCQKGVVEYQFRAGGASFESGQPLHYLYVHEPERPNQPLSFEAGDAFEREIAYFVNCVRTGHPPLVVTPADARLAVLTSLTARESLKTGQMINLPED